MARRLNRNPEDFAGLFLRLEELVLANSGEDEFEEVLKLVYAKLCDELRHKGTRFRRYDTQERTASEVNALLAEAVVTWPGVFNLPVRSGLTPEHLAVCVDVLADRSISGSGLQVIDSAFEYLVSDTSKGAKGQYFTPRHIVEFCVRMLKPTETDVVCDPACGSGAFLIHAVTHVYPDALSHGLAPERRRTIRSYCAKHIWGFDFEQRAAKVAKALMLVAGDGSANIVRLNSLVRPRHHIDLFSKAPGPDERVGDSAPLTIEDVMRVGSSKFKGFDIIMTNPPFAGDVQERPLLEQYELHRLKATRLERDALFLERCIGLLRPGGRMAIVMPDNKVRANAFGFLREWLIRHARVLAVVGLPRTAFMPHTSQKTSILFLQKRQRPGDVDPGEEVFFGVSERSGKDGRGNPVLRLHPSSSSSNALWESLDHDLCDILESYESYSSGMS